MYCVRAANGSNMATRLFEHFSNSSVGEQNDTSPSDRGIISNGSRLSECICIFSNNAEEENHLLLLLVRPSCRS